MTELPSVGNGAQAGENPRKNPFLNYKSAYVVKKYGVRLLPELYEHLNPMPFEAAAQVKIELAEDLRAEGIR
jgi:hypothetical protein